MKDKQKRTNGRKGGGSKYHETRTQESRLIKAASTRKWKTVENILKMISNFRSYQWEDKCCSECTNHHNTLHLILKYNPPLNVVRLIIKNEPKSVFEIDCLDHFPLQTALSYGTSSKVIEYLISQNKDAFYTLDCEGKTPLHLAVDGYEILSADYSTKLTSVATFSEIIDMLYKFKPSCVVKKDHNNMDVVRYAIKNQIDYEAVSILRSVKKTYVDSMNNRKKEEFRPRKSISFYTKIRRLSMLWKPKSQNSTCASSQQDSVRQCSWTT